MANGDNPIIPEGPDEWKLEGSLDITKNLDVGSAGGGKLDLYGGPFNILDPSGQGNIVSLNGGGTSVIAGDALITRTLIVGSEGAGVLFNISSVGAGEFEAGDNGVYINMLGGDGTYEAPHGEVYINVPGGQAVDCLSQAVRAEQGAIDQTFGTPSDADTGYSNYRGGRASGENSECYAGRYGDLHDPNGVVGATRSGETIDPNKIANASLKADSNLNVNETLTMSPGSDISTPQYQWDTPIEGLTLNEMTGEITGTLPQEGDYVTNITVYDGASGEPVDTKQYVIRGTTKGIHFQNPMGTVNRVTDGFMQQASNRSTHKGIDMSPETSAPGAPIFAAADGRVVHVRHRSGYGANTVIIEHEIDGRPQYSTLYGHMSSATVTEGQTVAQGDPIGTEGGNGTNGPNDYAPHLHFEIADPSIWQNGAFNPNAQRYDPLKLLNGTYYLKDYDKTISNGSDILAGANPSVFNGVGGLAKEAGFDPCASNYPNNPACGVGDPTSGVSGNSCNGAVSKGEVIDRMNATMDKHPELDAEDRKYLLFVARIESNFDPCAQNPKSSATGLFQMINSTAASYPHDRMNIESSTEAMIDLYQNEQLVYWNNYVNSGGRRLGRNGLTIANNANTRNYGSLSKTEFIYGLIHHDGIGNAQKGRSKGGVAYVQRQLRKMPAAAPTNLEPDGA